MKDIVKSLCDYVFSFGMFMFLVCVGFIFVMTTVLTAENERNERTRQRTEVCYSLGLVLVSTDAGERCADPRTLVKIK